MFLTGQEILTRNVQLGDLDSLGEFSKLDRGQSGLVPTLRDRGIRSALPNSRSYQNSEDGFKIENLDERNVSDVAVDLRVGEDIFYSEKVISRITDIDHLLELEGKGEVERVKKNQDGQFVLESDPEGKIIYYVPSHEKVALPLELEYILDAKSTTGRVFTMCNNSCQRKLDHAFSWLKPTPIIASVQPHVFPMLITPGKTSLYQIFIRYSGSNIMTSDEIRADQDIALFDGEGTKLDLKKKGRIGKDGIAMTFSTKLTLKAKTAEEVPEPIDMDARGVYDVEDYFEVIEDVRELELEARRGYLNGTVERIRVGNALSHITRENEESGYGLIGHFAGRIQPGWNGRITMEVMSNVDRVVSEGDLAGFVHFDRMTSTGKGYDGSYKEQANKVPLPPKMFKPLESQQSS